MFATVRMSHGALMVQSMKPISERTQDAAEAEEVEAIMAVATAAKPVFILSERMKDGECSVVVEVDSWKWFCSYRSLLEMLERSSMLLLGGFL